VPPHSISNPSASLREPQNSAQKVTVNQPQFTTLPPQTHHQKTTFQLLFFAKTPAKTPKALRKKNHSGISSTATKRG
jgi:hypothetical protein